MHLRQKTSMRWLMVFACLMVLSAPSAGFGCGREMCKIIPFMSPVCCVITQQCCKEAAELNSSREKETEKCVQKESLIIPSSGRPFPVPNVRFL